LEDLGCATVMPLGSPLVQVEELIIQQILKLFIENANIPVIVDAELEPSEATLAMEMGQMVVIY
jgi:thiazole synthase